MLETLLSFLLGWTNGGQCSANISSVNQTTVASIASTADAANLTIPVTHVYTVSKNIVALRIETGELIRGKQVAYEAEPGDNVKRHGWVWRQGKALGQLVPDVPNTIWLADQYVGPKLNTDCVDSLKGYKVITSDRTKLTPKNIYRKSNIRAMAETASWKFEWPMVHTLYLELPEDLVVGETYKINFGKKGIQNTTFIYKPEQTRSEAVQISHLGFDPDDPAKVAFLSTWMGNGGGVNYEENKPFWLIDVATGDKVYEGQTKLSQSKDYRDSQGRNHNETDVFIMDFSDFSVAGQYQIYVDGVGTSYEFEIGENTWRDGFFVSARGMYHQRSGIALEAPYTNYQRPRSFHPEDGMVVHQSTVPLMETRMGFLYGNQAPSAFESLVNTKTDQEVSNAWGGWMDAGDWDRRIPHLHVSRSFLELLELHPDYFGDLKLNLPESNNNLPDILDEALWGLDVFRRLQTEAGGIPGGIESAEHPKKGQGSWQESLDVMVYGPGIWSSYFYANVAARAAYVLENYDKALAKTYRDSAIRAMDWAEAELANATEEQHEIIGSNRNLAAAELYRLTGDDKWHQLFLNTTVFQNADAVISSHGHYDQSHSAFVYGRTQRPVNEAVRKNAIDAILRAAKKDMDSIESTGFKWNADPKSAIGWGSMTTPKTRALFHAHSLTGDEAYLRFGILATQFAAGANPSNMMYTIGLGHRNPKMPLMADVRVTGQEPPPGITVYGPMDVQNPNGHAGNWEEAIKKFAPEMNPSPWEWPTSEAYFDSYYYVPVTEFTVHQSIGPTAYSWGYIAANDQNE
ncbi:glycoside hydrolase family 9 protein [Leptothoe kymatousa]|uniref:Glycoside hydrolase family 9 protein n=1 Tax=Leptothoe kymatousa TAU-MAC 1615 TaxID=2364775 RepID=A0ABS5Y6U9_9CYAN|nr:glycoside hydrolase family 9 protein [Leptothoe kymatousa]MBT9313548.1 glycoside hydrolase family 9 protein [Leptothoe kymatousa TAU-MAC 1615]